VSSFWGAVHFNNYEEIDIREGESNSIAQEIVERLTKTVEQQIEVFDSQNQGHRIGTISNIIQASLINEAIVKPIAQQIIAHGENIAQAAHGSQANILHLYFSTPHPAPPPSPQRDEIDLLLEENPIEKLVDFEEQIENFQRKLKQDSSHVILIEENGGMGKSSLLYRFMHICKDEGHIYSYVDLTKGLLEVQDIIDKIGKHTGLVEEGSSINDLHRMLKIWGESLSRRSQLKKKCVILIDAIQDGIEKFLDLGRWLREDILGLVEPKQVRDEIRQNVDNLIIVIAGRQYTPRLYYDDWAVEYFTDPRYLPLRKWGEQEIRQYCKFIGMDDLNKHTILEIISQSKMGEPLMCSMILESRKKFRSIVLERMSLEEEDEQI
jgi:hypothetical protein